MQDSPPALQTQAAGAAGAAARWGQEQEHSPCWALSPGLGKRPGHQCSLPDLPGSLHRWGWGGGGCAATLQSGAPRAQTPRGIPGLICHLHPSCHSSTPSPQLIPRLWAPPGLGRAMTSVRFQGRVLMMRRPSGPGSPAHKAVAALLSSVLPRERMSEERLAGHGWATGLEWAHEYPTGETLRAQPWGWREWAGLL